MNLDSLQNYRDVLRWSYAPCNEEMYKIWRVQNMRSHMFDFDNFVKIIIAAQTMSSKLKLTC